MCLSFLIVFRFTSVQVYRLRSQQVIFQRNLSSVICHLSSERDSQFTILNSRKSNPPLSPFRKGGFFQWVETNQAIFFLGLASTLTVFGFLLPVTTPFFPLSQVFSKAET